MRRRGTTSGLLAPVAGADVLMGSGAHSRGGRVGATHTSSRECSSRSPASVSTLLVEATRPRRTAAAAMGAQTLTICQAAPGHALRDEARELTTAIEVQDRPDADRSPLAPVRQDRAHVSRGVDARGRPEPVGVLGHTPSGPPVASVGLDRRPRGSRPTRSSRPGPERERPSRTGTMMPATLAHGLSLHTRSPNRVFGRIMETSLTDERGS